MADQANLQQPAGYRLYNPNPHTVTGIQTASAEMAGSGYQTLARAVAGRLTQRVPTRRARQVVGLELYQAPDMDTFLAQFRAAWETAHGLTDWLDTRVALKEPAVLNRELQEFLTAEPVFGRVCDRDLSLFFDSRRWLELVARVNAAMQTADEGPLFVVGPGALLPPLRHYTDVALYAQVPRETVFFASEAGSGRNLGDDRDRGKWPRYKRSFYVDWPVQNRHLFEVLPICDFLIDMHDATAPTFADTELLINGMRYASQRPFRVRSLFMPGVWGGHRLQQLIPELPDEWPNCAWGFELVGPENTICFNVGDVTLWLAFDLFMHFEAGRILGSENRRRFGSFFPIRFDFLDTIDGTNLSCQVHPPDAYINAHFGEPFAQNEMYYILETRPEAKVYLGLQESTNREAFLADVARAQTEQIPFELTQHVNAWEANRGDLFLIPAGTVHCSGAGNLVLEISATPYIYTFKIYDYLRLDLNGQPRPISYERAFDVIDFSRKTGWVDKHLLPQPQLMAEGPGWRRFSLAASDFFFYSVERIELTEPYADSTEIDGVHILCVVEGQGVRVVRRADNTVLELSYAETGIIPAACGAYRLEPIGPGQVKAVKCYMRP